MMKASIPDEEYLRPTSRCSVLIPVYNGGPFIERAIESALQQGPAVGEIIVIDNCSTDGTWQLLQNLASDKIRVLRNRENIGMFANFNACLAQARCEVAVFLCADDRLAPGAVTKAIDTFTSDSSIVLINFKGQAVNPSGKRIRTLGNIVYPGVYEGGHAIRELLRFHFGTGVNPFNFPGGVFLRTHLSQKLKFDPNLEKCGDIDLFYRTLDHGKLAVVEHLGCIVTFHPDQTTIKGRREIVGFWEYLKIIEAFEKKLGNDFSRVLSSVKALALWNGIRTYRKSTFQEHWRFVSHRRKPHGAWFGLIRFFLMKCLLKLRRPPVLRPNIP